MGKGYIPEDTIRAILDAVNIRHIVEGYTPLKKQGRNWVGLCPFHQEKTPSFSINEDRQFFHCFGCGESGDAITFLMKIAGLDFVDAVTRLAGIAGIPIPETPISPWEKTLKDEQEELLRTLDVAHRFFRQNLLAPEGSQARAYLRKRGISNETVERFGIGWALDEWDGLIRHLEAQGIPIDCAEKAGLVIRKEGGQGKRAYYDRFRSRVIFPIQDRHGKIIAFGGRVLGEGMPKYLNSPETSLYHKGRTLYGISQAAGPIRQTGHGYVVEGYLDLIALAQAGVTEVVATLGTALTENHAKILRGLSKNWTLVFDGDEAGISAALRTLPILYAAELRVSVVTLPPGDDPDSLVQREGRDGWERIASSAHAGIDFAIDRGLARHGSTPDGRLAILEEILPILGSIQDPARCALLVGHVAQRLGIREEALWTRVTPRTSSSRTETVKAATSPSRIGLSRARSADEKLVAFVLSQPHTMAHFVDHGPGLWLDNGPLRDLWCAMEHVFKSEGCLEIGVLRRHIEALTEVAELAERLAREEHAEDATEETIRALRNYCENQRRRALRRALIEDLKKTGSDGDESRILRHLSQLL
ncbi:MAG: DNA primase [Deltaproteobacteria bacterium]